MVKTTSMRSRMKKTMSLQRLRSEVDRIDRRLAKLLNSRIRLCRRIGAFKARNGKKIFDATRERILLGKLISLNKGPIEDSELAGIYRVILKTSRRHQRKLQRRRA